MNLRKFFKFPVIVALSMGWGAAETGCATAATDQESYLAANGGNGPSTTVTASGGAGGGLPNTTATGTATGGSSASGGQSSSSTTSSGTGGISCTPVKETCNGSDDDCNGVADDNLDPTCTTGLLGQCALGTSSCIHADFQCTAINQPTAEICNGLDDNCDGQIDEGLDVLLTCGEGPCMNSIIACVNGVPNVCKEKTPPSTVEICGDEIDNNCDGKTDKGNDICCPLGSKLITCLDCHVKAGGTIECVGGDEVNCPSDGIIPPGCYAQVL